MSLRPWDDVLVSLDMMQDATISKASLSRTSHVQDTPVRLYAQSLDGESLPIQLLERPDCWSFTLGELQVPVTRLVVENGEGEEITRVEGLLPRTDKEYEQGFRSVKTRTDNPYLNFFIARQMALYFPGTVSYRVAGAVVAIYKAVEINEPNYITWAEDILKVAEELVPMSPVARSPRRNREHLRLSLWCAEWHLRLIQGEFEKFLECLNKVRRYVEIETLESYFNPAYPANTSLCILCLYYVATGNWKQAREVAEITVSLFQKSVRDADKNLSHFRELSVIHKFSYESLRISKQTEDLTEERVKEIFSICKRINATKCPQSFREMWKTFKEGVES